MGGHSGRRPGPSGTREAIAGAARRQFSQVGFDRSSLSSIAAEAGVDPALVRHFYGSKQQLFLTVMELPFDPASTLPQVFAGPRETVGLRLAHFFLGMLDREETGSRLLGMVRAGASEPAAAGLLRETVATAILPPMLEALGSDDAELRANLVGTQLLGLVVARYLIAVEPLASLEADTVAAAIAPTLQHYLTEPLDLESSS